MLLRLIRFGAYCLLIALTLQNSAQATKIASLEASVTDFQSRNDKLKDVLKAMKAKISAHEETIKKVSANTLHCPFT